MLTPKLRVLVVGAYWDWRTSLVQCQQCEWNHSEHWDIDQQWVHAEPCGKFPLVNRVLKKMAEPLMKGVYRYLILSDDDIRLPHGFADRYLDLVKTFDFALAQPARTLGSNIDHGIVLQQPRVTARRTRFVEIGPVVSIHQRVFSKLLPFDESNPMGWGFDYVWPYLLSEDRLGIVDAVPVSHPGRAGETYSAGEAGYQMQQYLAAHAHLEPKEAYVTLETYA